MSVRSRHEMQKRTMQSLSHCWLVLGVGPPLKRGQQRVEEELAMLSISGHDFIHLLALALSRLRSSIPLFTEVACSTPRKALGAGREGIAS